MAEIYRFAKKAHPDEMKIRQWISEFDNDELRREYAMMSIEELMSRAGQPVVVDLSDRTRHILGENWDQAPST